MKLDARDDWMSDCRSFGSNCHPCSQSRKISIGVMVDSVLKKKLEATKVDEVNVCNAEKSTSKNENSFEGNKEGRGVRVSQMGKQAEAPEQESSPWISTRSKSPALKTVDYAKQTSNFPAINGGQNNLSGGNESPEAYAFHVAAKQTLSLKSGDGKQKNFGRVTYKRKGTNDGTADMVEEFSFATAQEGFVSDKGGREDKTVNIRSEALRMKLWDLLGNVSSPNEQFYNSQTPEPDAKSSKLEKSFDPNGNTVVKSRQNSDTIETDSENPDHTVSRPVTRSLTRKRAPTKVQPNKVKIGTSSSHKQKFQDKNVLSFKEGLSVRLHAAVNDGSSMSKIKKSGRKSSKVEPSKICFADKDNMGKNPQATDLSKIPPPAEKTSLSSRMKDFQACPPQGNSDYVKSKSGSPEKKYHQIPVAKETVRSRDVGSPAIAENTDWHEDCGNPYLKNIEDHEDDLPNLTFGRQTPIKTLSLSSPPRADQTEQDFYSPASTENILGVGNIHSFKAWGNSRTEFDGSNPQTESSDDEEELKDSPTRNLGPFTEEKGGVLSESSSQEKGCTNSEDDSPINEGFNFCTEKETFSPETGSAESEKHVLRPFKRLRSQGGIRFKDCSPISPSVKGNGEGNDYCIPSEQNQEDGLSRAVTLFALALERLESKMKSVTRKKASEILMSALDRINLQLQNVQSQIQTDVGKLCSLSKSKRKRLETRFQEQEEQLKLIHEKFKEELNQHLQDCISTLEGLEANQIEFKGTTERQKASHWKLLLQVEEAIETQLNDAERRVTAIHRLARERMLELKHVITECLKDGVIG